MERDVCRLYLCCCSDHCAPSVYCFWQSRRQFCQHMLLQFADVPLSGCKPPPNTPATHPPQSITMRTAHFSCGTVCMHANYMHTTYLLLKPLPSTPRPALLLLLPATSHAANPVQHGMFSSLLQASVDTTCCTNCSTLCPH